MADSKPKKRTTNKLDRSHTDEVFDYILDVELAAINNAYESGKESANKKTILIQDIMNICLTVLGGAITLKIFANPNVIKTPVLFNIATAGLLICVVVSLLLRLATMRFWQQTTDIILAYEEKLRLAVGDMKFHDNEHHFQASENFELLTSEGLSLPVEPKKINQNTMLTLVLVFAFSLISIAVSLLFKITVN